MCDTLLRNIRRVVNIRICMWNPCSIFKKIIIRTILLKSRTLSSWCAGCSLWDYFLILSDLSGSLFPIFPSNPYIKINCSSLDLHDNPVPYFSLTDSHTELECLWNGMTQGITFLSEGHWVHFFVMVVDSTWPHVFTLRPNRYLSTSWK